MFLAEGAANTKCKGPDRLVVTSRQERWGGKRIQRPVSVLVSGEAVWAPALRSAGQSPRRRPQRPQLRASFVCALQGAEATPGPASIFVPLQNSQHEIAK